MKNIPNHYIRDHVFKKTSKKPTGLKSIFLNSEQGKISDYNDRPSYLRSEYNIHSKYGFDILNHERISKGEKR